jgi:hypothetical protein
MKKFLLFFAIAATGLVFFSTGCTEDDTVDVEPTAAFTADDPTGVAGTYPTDDFQVSDTASFVYLGITATAGTNDLSTITVYEDGVEVATDRLQFRDLRDGSTILAQNPLALFNDNTAGFTIEVGINPHDVYETRTYSFEISDGTLSTTLNIDITTFSAGTPISTTLMGQLLNQAGPAGTGALDLDTGNGTGTSGAGSDAADIRDQGIDLGLPNDQNWIQKIAPINGTTIRTPGANFPGDYNFADVSTVEEIEGFFNDGEDLVGGESDVVAVGDVFLVQSADGTRYYLIECADIVTTPDNNEDYYEFDIKF